MKVLLSGLVVAALASGAQALPVKRALIDLRDMEGWEVGASEQVAASLRREADGSACLDYDFNSVSGYAVLRHALNVEWPAAFALQLRMKGSGPANDLQVKLVDASGDNVWWVNRPAFPLPRAFTELTFRSRHFSFAWGPTADRALSRTASLELVVAAGQGGKGELCVSRVRVEKREPEPDVWPEPLVRWRAGVLDVDLRRLREFNGLALRWAAEARPESYEVLASDDARRWRLLRRVEQGSGGFEALFLPESEARYLRLSLGGGEAAPRVEIRDARQWPTLNAVVSELARHAPRGDVPRAFLGEQNYWTLVGVDGGGERSALLSEDGALEVGRGGFSVEPAVLVEGEQPITWADVEIGHSLREGYLPMPEVHWRHGAFTLDVSAAAEGEAEAPRALVRYALTNTGGEARTCKLLLAVRPWQVNPPQQFLATPGGVRRIERLSWKPPRLSVNGTPGPSFEEVPSRVTGLPGAGGSRSRPCSVRRSWRSSPTRRGAPPRCCSGTSSSRRARRASSPGPRRSAAPAQPRPACPCKWARQRPRSMPGSTGWPLAGARASTGSSSPCPPRRSRWPTRCAPRWPRSSCRATARRSGPAPAPTRGPGSATAR